MEKLLPVIKKIFHLFKIFIRFVRAKAKQAPFFTRSLILHLFLLILISGTIPRCTTKVEKPRIIEVNIIQAPVVEQAKAKPEPVKQKKIEPPKKEEPKKEEPKKEEPKKEKPKPVETKKKEEVEPKKSDVPALKKEEIKKKPKPEEPKKEEPKKEEKKQEAEEEQEGKKSLLKDLEKKELDEIFDELDKPEEPKKEEPKKEEPKVEKEVTANKDAEFVPDAKFVNEIKSIVQGQIKQCWSIPIGAKNVDELTVELYIKLDIKGNVKMVKIVDQYKYDTDNYYRVLADSAVWAVKECSPLVGLPEDKHKFWEEIQFSFDAASVL